MKKTLVVAVAIVLALAIVVSGVGVAFAGKGNNAPTGPHYNLNIIGMSHEKPNMGDKVGGHVIFVELISSKMGKVRVATDILLIPGDTFYVIDGNGTDGEASFQLPVDVTTSYTVWVRALGKPGGEADMKTCAWDPVEKEYVCGVSVLLIRTKGKKTFMDVTDLLLKIDGVNLFDPIYEDYFWSYHNNGLKLAQLRFYPVE